MIDYTTAAYSKSIFKIW